MEKAGIFRMNPLQKVSAGCYSPEGSKFYAITNDDTLIIINPYDFTQ